MKAKGVLYTVEGPRGVYYAIHDPATGRVWTERTESATLALARELGILIAAEELVTTEEFLLRTGRDAPERLAFAKSPMNLGHQTSASDEQIDAPLRSPEPELDVAPPMIPSPASTEPIVASRMDVGASCFAADLPIRKAGESPFEDLPPPPPLQGFATFHGDLLDPTRREV